MEVEENKRVVREYFARLGAGDPGVADLLDEEVTWWVPPSSPMAGTHRGKAEVLALMGSGVGLYSREHPLRTQVLRSIAEGDWVAVEFVLRAVTARGQDYENHYHFAFRLRDGRIVEVREHLDTQYAKERLFPDGA